MKLGNSRIMADAPIDPPLPSLAMVEQDPLIRAAKKALKQSNTGTMDALLAERSRWQRKLTIATNKLEAIDLRIRQTAYQLAQRLDGAEKSP